MPMHDTSCYRILIVAGAATTLREEGSKRVTKVTALKPGLSGRLRSGQPAPARKEVRWGTTRFGLKLCFTEMRVDLLTASARYADSGQGEILRTIGQTISHHLLIGNPGGKPDGYLPRAMFTPCFWRTVGSLPSGGP